jgi:hypothetical protein
MIAKTAMAEMMTGDLLRVIGIMSLSSVSRFRAVNRRSMAGNTTGDLKAALFCP